MVPPELDEEGNAVEGKALVDVSDVVIFPTIFGLKVEVVALAVDDDSVVFAPLASVVGNALLLVDEASMVSVAVVECVFDFDPIVVADVVDTP